MPVRVSEPPPRELILSPSAALELDAVRGSHPRFQQVYDGLVWIILRKPEIGDANSITRMENGERVTVSFWIVRSQPKNTDLPDVLLVYRFDDRSVEVLGLRTGRLNAF